MDSNYDGGPSGQIDDSGSILLEPETNLDEVAAPPPACDRSANLVRQQEYLENQHSENLYYPHRLGLQAKETEPNQARVPKRKGPDVGSNEKPVKRSHIWKSLRTASTVAYLIVFSLIGTLSRLAIESLTFYPGAPVSTSVLWANVGGSIIMGFLSEDQELFRSEEVEARIPDRERDGHTQRRVHLKVHKKTIPLYIGLTTGFCGSLTSFSTFIRDVFLTLANILTVPIGPYSEVSLFAPSPDGMKAPNGGLPHRLLRKVLDPLTVILASLFWIAVILLVILLPQNQKGIALWSSELWRGPYLFSLVFAPVGCLARFFLSLKLNGRIPYFPLGTFVVNVGGTMVLGMAYSLQHASISSSSVSGGSFTGCQVLQGIMDGFCGCLTTVSTWVLELSDLRRRHVYVCGGMSVAVALCALIVEIGSLKWTRGLATPACFS